MSSSAKQPKQRPLLIDRREAARLLGISPRKLWDLSNIGELPVMRIGNALRYDPNDLRAWIAANKEHGNG